MNRRGAVFAAVVPLVTLLALLAAPDQGGATVPDPPSPPVTVNDFIPEDRNLSDCIGALERPGCGSESRGGWRQVAVFTAVVAGLGVVFLRIMIGVRRNRSDDPATDSGTP